MSDIIKVFAAYPDKPASIAETLEDSYKIINQGGIFLIKSWKELDNSGNSIIASICKQINNIDMFICELTDLNFNVLFELGYAISKGKKIKIFIDQGIEKAKSQFDSLGLFTTIGYDKYSNSQNIVSSFLKEVDDSNKESLIEQTISNMHLTQNTEPVIFYLKSSIETQASINLSRVIDKQKIQTFIDDPQEVSTRTLPWYIENIFNSCGVIAHFLAQNHNNNILYNAKASFVSGLAYGLEIPVLMLAHAPFQSPIDYKDLLQVHDTASKCEKFANDWINLNRESFKKNKDATIFTKTTLKAQSELQKIDLGDIVAENEIGTLLNYYIKTASFTEALRSNHSIFIGRKGCGKTANLIKLANEFDRPQNHVCVIKPVAYEIEGVLYILRKELSKAESI